MLHHLGKVAQTLNLEAVLNKFLSIGADPLHCLFSVSGNLHHNFLEEEVAVNNLVDGHLLISTVLDVTDSLVDAGGSVVDSILNSVKSFLLGDEVPNLVVDRILVVEVVVDPILRSK